MPDPRLYPLRFEPILRRLIWGGRRLGTVLGKPIGSEADYAESWELSDYQDQVSLVRGGALDGTSLRDLIRARPAELLGPALANLDQFPLLVKFIDANQDLSVQVHPDDARGRRLANDNGKTETWIVLAAEPESVIYAGLRAGVGPDEFRRAIASGEVEPLLHRFEARPGDAILIEAGTVHAIGAGVMLAEIQQMSDATFRVFDWNRLGPDGQPRALHIDQAMESTNFALGPVHPMDPVVLESRACGTRERLAASRYFACERMRLHPTDAWDGFDVGQTDRFTILIGMQGKATIVDHDESYELDAGETILLPASVGACQVFSEQGAVVLTCVVP